MTLRFFFSAFVALLLYGCSLSSDTDLARPEGLLERQNDGSFEPAYISPGERRAGIPRCIDLNNYWCLKAPSDSYWNGQIGRDEDGHAHFRSPVYAGRAFARIMRTYHERHGLSTPREIVSRYAPSQDCPNPQTFCPLPGTAAISPANERLVRMDGRDAIYRSTLPQGYGVDDGCANPVFLCRDGYNPNWNYYDHIAESAGVDMNEDLGLFQDNGRFNRERAIVVFQAFALFEISARYLVEEQLILDAIRLEERDALR